MKENKIVVIIDKPIGEVFEFTTNPKNTHLWIPFIDEEVSEEYPPKIGTKYKNHRGNGNWNIYKVVEFKENEIFTLVNLEGNYSVRYIYKKINDNKTEMTYFELVKEGDISKPFTEDILLKLKSVMEKQ